MSKNRKIINVLLFLAEAVLVARYGFDTYRAAVLEHAGEITIPWFVMALSALDVALNEGVFLLLLQAAHHLGDGQRDSKLRPLAAAGAAALFANMVGIASGVVAVRYASRVSGAMLVGYVSAGVLVDWTNRVLAWLAQRRRAHAHAGARTHTLQSAASNVAYVLASVCTFAVAVLANVLPAVFDYTLAAIARLRASWGVFNMQAPEQAYRHAPHAYIQAPLAARAHIRPRARISATYETSPRGMRWTCDVCEATSAMQARGQEWYATPASAKAAFAAHARRHTAAGAVYPMIEED